METPQGKRFRPDKPWPTARTLSKRTLWLIALIAALQFLLNGLQNVLGATTMLIVWIVGGLVVAPMTFQIEKHFERHRQRGLR